MKVSWVRRLLNTLWLWSWNTTFYPDTFARRTRKKVIYLSGGFTFSYTGLILLVVLGLWILREGMRWLWNLI